MAGEANSAAGRLSPGFSVAGAGRRSWPPRPHPSADRLETVARPGAVGRPRRRNHQDALGIAVPETGTDHNRFDDPAHVPSGWTATMPDIALAMGSYADLFGE